MPQIKLTIHPIRLKEALRACAELPDKDSLVLHIEDSLVIVPWSKLQRIAGQGAITILPPGPGKKVADNVGVANAFALNPKTNRILLAREGEIIDIDPSQKIEDQKIPATGLSVGTFAAAVDPAGKRALFSVVRDVNFDFSEYAVISVDLASGKIVPETTIGSNADLEFIWDAKLSAWFIGDTSRAFAWRWDTVAPAVKLQPPPDDPMIAATFTSSNEGLLISTLVTSKNGTPELTIGRADKDRITWSPAVPVPGGSVTFARRNPTRPLWACLADTDSGQQIQLRDAAGKLLASAPVRSSTLLNKLTWSAYSPNRLWGSGFRALAEITLSDSPTDTTPDLKIPPK
jgi:hypothetical protein